MTVETTQTVAGPPLRAAPRRDGVPPPLAYRPEIDGLRAVAVAPVILFHAGFAPFSGGYVGVDVFFVISGYLITTILLADLSRGAFSIARFYERRARRLLPALFVVLGVSSVWAAAALPPPDAERFFESLLATLLFVSNFYFEENTGYFDPAAEAQPLLHTWSLAVEEQFYLVFPLLLLTLSRRAPGATPIVLAALLLASLVAAEIGARRFADTNFYMLPTRLWELLAGALCALALAGGPPRPHRLFSALGLALIVGSVLLLSPDAPTPSLAIAPAVLGAVLVILFAGPGAETTRLLSHPALVGVGLVSYSAYLWHQPLFAFARLGAVEPPSDGAMGALALASLGLAWLTWRFVETPFRRRGPSAPPRRTLALSGLAGAVALGAVGAAGVATGGFERFYLARLAPDQAALYQAVKAATTRPERLPDDGACRFHVERLSATALARVEACAARHGPGVAVIGDSHAMDVYAAYAGATAEPFVFGLAQGRCRAHDPGRGCAYEALLAALADRPAALSRFVYAQAGFRLLVDADGRQIGRDAFRAETLPPLAADPAKIERVADYLDRLAAFGRVVWLGPRLEPHVPPWSLLGAACAATDAGGEPERAARVSPEIRALFRRLDRAAAAAVGPDRRFRYVSGRDALRFEDPADLFDCGAVYWFDGDHWSVAGARRFGPRLDAALRAAGF